MALRNAFGDLGLDSTLQAIRDRLPAALGGTGGVKVDVGSSALPSGAATSANQSDGSQKSQVVDGSGNVVGTTGNALDVNIKSGGGSSTVAGAKSNNAGGPGNTNLGVLPSVANAAAQSWTEGNQVASSTDLKGNQRTRIQDAAGNDRGANVNASNQLSVSVDNTPTVTANAGTNLNTSALALDATLTGGTQKSKLVDSGGTNVASVDASGALAIQSGGSTGSAVPTRAVQVGGSDGTNLRAIKVSSTGVISVDSSASTQPVSGTVTANQGGTWTVQPGNTANTTAWKVDGSAVTQPVSGTVTSNLGTLNGAATSANQTNGSQQSQVVDGSGNVIGSTSNALNVSIRGNTTAFSTSTKQSDGSQKSQVVDGSGNVIGSTSNALDVNVKSGGITGFSTSANQTNGTQQTQITDGTNIGSVLKSDGTAAGQNAQMVAASYQSQTWSVSSVTGGTVYDVGNYKSVSVQILTQYTGTTPTITWQASNDGVNWNGFGLIISTGNTSLAASTTTTGIYNGPLYGRYFRLNFTGAYTSGSSTGTIVFSTQATVTHGWIGTTTVQGGKTNNNAAPGATNVSVIPGIANAAQPSSTEGNAVMASMDLKGNQRMRISDAAGNDRGVNVNASNQLSTADAASAATGAAVPASGSYQGAIAKTANPTAATDGNLVGTLADKLGKQVVVGSIRDLKVQQQTTITSSTAETTIGTAVASTFLDLYGLILTNTSASTTKVTIKDSTAGTTRASFEVPATETRGFMLNESASMTQATVNNNWTATCGTSVANMEITALFVKNT